MPDALVARHCRRCACRLHYPRMAARHDGLCGHCWSQGWCDPLCGARVPVETQRAAIEHPRNNHITCVDN